LRVFFAFFLRGRRALSCSRAARDFFFFSSAALVSHTTKTLSHAQSPQNTKQQEHGVAPGALLLLERAAAVRPRAADETARSGRKGRGAAAVDDSDDEQEETEDVWAPALAASLCEQVSLFLSAFSLSRARVPRSPPALALAALSPGKRNTSFCILHVSLTGSKTWRPH
jgi:hypothetical protein